MLHRIWSWSTSSNTSGNGGQLSSRQGDHSPRRASKGTGDRIRQESWLGGNRLLDGRDINPTDRNNSRTHLAPGCVIEQTSAGAVLVEAIE